VNLGFVGLDCEHFANIFLRRRTKPIKDWSAPVLAIGMLRIPCVSPKAQLTLPVAAFVTPSETLRNLMLQVLTLSGMANRIQNCGRAMAFPTR